MQKPKPWKLIDLLKTTTGYFQKKNIENPRLNAERLLCPILKMERINLYIEFERPISESELSQYRAFVSRRANNEPLQYILGETEFMGLPFKVTPDVLIPRPETEILVEEILKLKDQNKNLTNMLDIGTGSGCIPISLAHYWPQAQITGIDISAEALEIAKENKELNKTENITFIEKDLFNDWPDENLAQNFDIIISNPPYVTEKEIDGLQNEVKEFEPTIALTDFSDGLRFYRHIFSLINDGKLKCKFLFFEMSGSQPEKIINEAKKYSFESIEVIKDLTEIERVLKIEV